MSVSNTINSGAPVAWSQFVTNSRKLSRKAALDDHLSSVLSAVEMSSTWEVK